MSNPSDIQATAPNTAQTIPQATTDPTDLILLIFIHGFKGTDSTFGEFPQRLQHILSESIDNTVVEGVVFPAYETKGELNAAVVSFADWLTDLTVKREIANGGAGKAKVVLCGHSMGGLLAADALIEFMHTRPDKRAPLWPKIVACIAYDTPYLGLDPSVIKNGANQAAQLARTAQNVLNSFKTWRSKTPSGAAAAAATAAVPSPIDTNVIPAPDVPKERDEAPKSPTTPKTPTAESEGTTVTSLWQKWAAPAAVAIGGAVLAGAAGTVYYKREEVGVGYTWVTDHLKYVGNLWNRQELDARLDRMLDIETHMGVLFHTFYTYIPANPPAYPDSRTFIILPHRNTPLATHFMPNRNTLASDEIQAHTGMFDNKTNDGYYDIGLVTAKLIREAVFAHRRFEANTQFPPAPPAAQAQARPPTPSQHPGAVKAAVRESVAARQREAASTAAVHLPAAVGGVTVAATAVAVANAASAAAPAPAAPPPAVEEGGEDDEDDDDEEEESEDEDEHIPVMEKPHFMAEKVETTQAASAPKATDKMEEEEDEDEDEDEEDEEGEEEEEEDDEDEDEEDEEEEEDEDEDEEEAEAQPAKK